MKKYFEPILEITLIDDEDLIRTSDENYGGNLDEDEMPIIPW